MPGVQQLISMIVSLRQLQLQQAAQDLQRKQLGLTAQGGLREQLSGMEDPNQMMAHIPELEEQTGLSPMMLSTIIGQTPPATATTRAGAARRGMQQVGGALDPTIATREMTGALPGQLAEDDFMKSIVGGAEDYLMSLPPERRQPLYAGFLSRQATGMDVGSATRAAATADFFGSAPQDVKDRAVAIGAGLAPSASEDLQRELGWAGYRAQQRASEMGLALERLRIKASLDAAGQTTTGQAFRELNDLIQQRSELLTNMVRNSATMTPEGKASFVDQINAFNQQIRMLAPQVYGKGAPYEMQDMPKDATAGTTGLWQYFKQWLQQ